METVASLHELANETQGECAHRSNLIHERNYSSQEMHYETPDDGTCHLLIVHCRMQ